MSRITIAVLIHKDLLTAVRSISSWKAGISRAKAGLILLLQDVREDDLPLLTLLESINAPIRAQRSFQNLGVAGGRQRLLDIWSGGQPELDDIIVFMDDDIIAENSAWVEYLTHQIRDNKDIDAFGAYGVEFKQPAPDTFTMHNTTEYGEVHAVSGGATAYRAEVVYRGCEFDQQFSPFWHEDIDFSMQIRNTGGSIWASTLDRAGLIHKADKAPDERYWEHYTRFVGKWSKDLKALTS